MWNKTIFNFFPIPPVEDRNNPNIRIIQPVWKSKSICYEFHIKQQEFLKLTTFKWNILVRKFRSDRGLEAHVRHVAANSSVLWVLAVLWCDVFNGAVPDGPLLPEALHLIHVDRTHSWTSRQTDALTTLKLLLIVFQGKMMRHILQYLRAWKHNTFRASDVTDFSYGCCS